jgi:hypothetical protein
MTTFLSTEGFVEIPEPFRRADSLQPGARCEVQRVGRNEYRLIVADEQSAKPASLYEVLMSCPVKDWWQEPDCSERTSLQPPALFAE